MARLITLGFEWGAGDGAEFDYYWNHSFSPAAGITTPAGRTGNCLRIPAGESQLLRLHTSPGDENYNAVTFAANLAYAERFYLRLSALPAATSTLHTFPVGSLQIDPSGRLSIDGTHWSAALTANTWYRVEVAFRTDSGAGPFPGKGYLELRLDGTTVSQDLCVSGLSLSQEVGFFAPADAILDVDDYALNDDTGGWQDTWPGPGNIYLLRPNADNSRGAWLAGTSYSVTTTDLWDAVNNQPPLGGWNIYGRPSQRGIGWGTDRMITSNAAGGQPDDITFGLETFPGSGAIAAVSIMAAVSVGETAGGTFPPAANPVDAYIAAQGHEGGRSVFWENTPETSSNHAYDYRRIAAEYPASSAPTEITLSRRTVTSDTALNSNAVGAYVDSGYIAQDPLPATFCAAPARRLMCVL